MQEFEYLPFGSDLISGQRLFCMGDTPDIDVPRMDDFYRGKRLTCQVEGSSGSAVMRSIFCGSILLGFFIFLGAACPSFVSRVSNQILLRQCRIFDFLVVGFRKLRKNYNIPRRKYKFKFTSAISCYGEAAELIASTFN